MFFILTGIFVTILSIIVGHSLPPEADGAYILAILVFCGCSMIFIGILLENAFKTLEKMKKINP